MERKELHFKIMKDHEYSGTVQGQTVPLLLKDLSKIGRNLDKTIIVDNIAENFLL
jgi:hypothetical protein